MMARYKLSSRDLLGDAGLAWRMLAKGRLKLLPEGIRDKAAVRRIFAREEDGKGDRHLLCEAPSGPFRQKVPVPFSRREE